MSQVLSPLKRPHQMSLRDGIGYSMRRYYVDAFFHTHVADFSGARKILDIGGTKDKKRGQFDLRNFSDRIITVNISDDRGTDIIADASKMPFASNRFDVVICGEVLEHVTDPQDILNEITRVMEPGGRVYLTAPFLFPIHADPHDYRRYTNSCWELMLKRAGLDVMEIVPQGTFLATLTDMVRMWIYNKAKTRIFRFGLYALLVPFRALVLGWEDKKSIWQDPFYTRFPTGYGVIASKTR